MRNSAAEYAKGLENQSKNTMCVVEGGGGSGACSPGNFLKFWSLKRQFPVFWQAVLKNGDNDE